MCRSVPLARGDKVRASGSGAGSATLRGSKSAPHTGQRGSSPSRAAPQAGQYSPTATGSGFGESSGRRLPQAEQKRASLGKIAPQLRQRFISRAAS